MRHLKDILGGIATVLLMLFGCTFAVLGLVVGFAWEHARVGFWVGTKSPDWIGGKMEQYWPRKTKEER